MTVHVKIYPIAGLCDKTHEMELSLDGGSMSEVMPNLQKRFGVESLKTEALMFMHNGRALERNKDVAFQDGDDLWLLPLLSGG